jgi:hypothetical protein
MTDKIDSWVEEGAFLEDAGDLRLGKLLLSARRGLIAISEVEAGAAPPLIRRRRAAPEPRTRAGGIVVARGLAGVAAVMALAALLSSPPAQTLPVAVEMERVVVKHFSLESVRDGRVRNLEITLHRVQKKEKSHVSDPLL